MLSDQTVEAFFDELVKIAGINKTALNAQVLQSIAAKGAKRGWSGARETKSIMRLAKREGQAVSKAVGGVHSPEAFAHTAVRPSAHNPTVAARGAPAMGGTQANVVPQSVPAAGGALAKVAPKPAPAAASAGGGSNLRRQLAMGGAVAGGGMMVGHAMGNRQQQAR